MTSSASLRMKPAARWRYRGTRGATATRSRRCHWLGFSRVHSVSFDNLLCQLLCPICADSLQMATAMAPSLFANAYGVNRSGEVLEAMATDLGRRSGLFELLFELPGCRTAVGPCSTQLVKIQDDSSQLCVINGRSPRCWAERLGLVAPRAAPRKTCAYSLYS